MHNTVHIAGRGSVVRQLRILASQFRVLRTGTLFEIRPDNLQVTVSCNNETGQSAILLKTRNYEKN